MPKCTAKAKSTGKPCQRDAMHGTTVCQVHGGKGALASMGPAHHAWKDGRHAKGKYKFRDLQERMQEERDATTAIEQGEEIGIFNILIQDSLDRLDAGDPGERWLELRRTLHQFQQARRAAQRSPKDARHSDRMVEALAKIEHLIEQGGEQVDTRKELRQTIIDQDRIIRSERQRIMDAQEVMTLEQGRILFQAIMHEINACVKDNGDRARLNGRLFAIAGLTTG